MNLFVENSDEFQYDSLDQSMGRHSEDSQLYLSRYAASAGTCLKRSLKEYEDSYTDEDFTDETSSSDEDLPASMV